MVVFLALALWAWSALGSAGSAGADVTCGRVASPSGTDGSAGTAASPWRTANYMIEHLNPGETGCFKGGTYTFSEVTFDRSAVAVTSYPGERATLRGTLKIEPGAEDVTVSELNLDGRGGATNIGPFIFGNGAKFVDDDVTNEHTEICFVVGSANPSEPPTTGAVIEGSRIHDCGATPSTNQDHGIYVANSSGLVIRDNWIYDNTDRGIQLYPDAVGTQVYGNVIVDNGEGVIVSNGSSGNIIRNNVVADSQIRWNIEASNLYGTGNVFTNNCVWSSQGGYYGQDGGVMSPQEHGPGLTVASNTVSEPHFENVADSNFQTSSPCLPAGETSVSTPSTGQAPSEVAVTLQPPANQVPQGAPVTLHGTVSTPEQPKSSAPVTIQVFKNDHWRKFGRAQVDKGGNFKIRKRIGRRIGGAKVHLRAKVSSLSRSKPVTVRFRRS